MDLLPRLVLHTIDGFVFGWVYALIAFGLSLIFGLLLIINVAHGTLYMLGAVFGWFLARELGGGGGGYWAALVLAPLAVGVLAAGVELTILRPIEKEPVMTILSTFGLLLVFEHTVLGWVGGSALYLKAGIAGHVSLLGFQYSTYRLFVAGAAFFVALGLWAFLYKTRYGIWVRAVRQNSELSLVDGIPVRKVNTLAFGLGGALAGLSGVLSGPLVSVTYQMGLNVLIVAFIVVIVGGLGDLRGAVAAALILGVAESLATVFVNATLAKVFALLFVTTFLFFRPDGLFVRRG